MSTPFPPPPCSTKPGKPPPPASVTTMPGTRDARALLAPDDFSAVTATVTAHNPRMDCFLAERVVLEALKFVATAAESSETIAPSHLVDKGWHALILHTALYQRLCSRLGGFVDHDPGPHGPPGNASNSIDQTVTSIELAGFPVDRNLWQAQSC